MLKSRDLHLAGGEKMFMGPSPRSKWILAPDVFSPNLGTLGSPQLAVCHSREFVKDLDSHEGCRPCHHPQHLHSQGT